MENINYESFGGFTISKELFEWVDSNIPEGSIILELGSGYGTKELVKKYKVYSVEHDEQWLNLEPKSNYIYAPLKDGWFDVDVLSKELPKKYDLLLIDGPPNIYRGNFINHYELFNNAKVIIVDDTHRENDSKIVELIISKSECIFEEFQSERKKFTVIKRV